MNGQCMYDYFTEILAPQFIPISNHYHNPSKLPANTPTLMEHRTSSPPTPMTYVYDTNPCNSPKNISSCHSVGSSSGYSSTSDAPENILSHRIAPSEYHVGIRTPNLKIRDLSINNSHTRSISAQVSCYLVYTVHPAMYVKNFELLNA